MLVLGFTTGSMGAKSLNLLDPLKTPGKVHLTALGEHGPHLKEEPEVTTLELWHETHHQRAHDKS